MILLECELEVYSRQNRGTIKRGFAKQTVVKSEQ